MATGIHCDATTIQEFTFEFLKEKRRLDLLEQNGQILIRRYSDGITAIQDEVVVIEFLKTRLPEIKIPRILSYGTEYIDFEYIEGIRCFNFLTQMKNLYLYGNVTMRAFKAAQNVLSKLNQDLREFQTQAGEIKKLIKSRNYPYEAKVIHALDLLSIILFESQLDIEVADDVRRLTMLLDGSCNVPFRDSTPKNAIIHFPGLSLGQFSSEEERNQSLMAFLDHEEVDVFANNIYHLDFSGFPFFCVPWDDWIGLNLHESTRWLLSQDESIDKKKEDDAFLATAIFRFIRLGTRKLAYQLLHKNAAHTRYKHENTIFYFEHIRNWISQLASRGTIKGNQWLVLNAYLMQACSLIPDIDYFEHFNKNHEIVTSGYYSDVYPY